MPIYSGVSWAGIPIINEEIEVKIAIGDYVIHKYRSWLGKMKVTAINFDTYSLRDGTEKAHYYDKCDLELYKESVADIIDPLYCTCAYPHANIVESSIQVHRSMDAHETFKFCRTCKKERK